ncbi:SDR family NAD(P)-dependent oxidoreductase [Jannaschia sp. R86511]|uniref:SDR family NAD(P)-dependent oxidoreductase n=1 Tax=Jannaschia sp. R86511 TaxID=3093853 RepID=UPI0036D240F6
MTGQGRKLSGMTAFVTGAASGIGRACALALAARGATIVATDIDDAGLEALLDGLHEIETTVVTARLDVRDEPAVRAAIAKTVADHRQLDLVLNCAGIMPLAPALEADVDEWTATIEINVLGLMYVTHAALPHLVQSKGSLVQMSSMAARAVGRGASAYYASKFAVNGFSEGIRQEVTESGVRVVVVEPGSTQTSLRTHITHEASRAAIEARVATYRQLQPMDVADAVMYAITAPHHVAVNEILLRPTDQA